MFNKNSGIELPCPECGYKKKFRIKELEQNVEYICAGCKKTVIYDTSNFNKGLKDSEKMIKDFINKNKR
ncbi:MAG: primase-helicase zinc-binding domain-containing protein [Thiobacillus sp.]